MAGLLTLRSSASVGLAVTALGFVGSIYNGHKDDQAKTAAKEVLKQMPTADRERFGKFESEVASARDLSFRGHMLGAGVALISMSQITRFVNPRTSLVALSGSVGNHIHQTQFSIPKTLSNYRSDVESWNREQINK